MTRDDIQAWLDRYLDAWRTYDPQKIADLFSEDAEYRYHPWDEPERGRETIVRGWLEPAGNASDRDAPGSYDADYEPYADTPEGRHNVVGFHVVDGRIRSIDLISVSVR